MVKYWFIISDFFGRCGNGLFRDFFIFKWVNVWVI